MANNKIRTTRQNLKSWQDTGGDYALTIKNLANAAVRVGARHDRGATLPYVDRLEVEIVINGLATAPAAGDVGNSVDVYIAQSDGTNADSNIGTGDAAGAVDDLPNMRRAASAFVRNTTTTQKLISRIVLEGIAARYYSIVIHNRTGVALHASNTHTVKVTEVPLEIE